MRSEEVEGLTSGVAARISEALSSSCRCRLAQHRRPKPDVTSSGLHFHPSPICLEAVAKFPLSAYLLIEWLSASSVSNAGFPGFTDGYEQRPGLWTENLICFIYFAALDPLRSRSILSRRPSHIIRDISPGSRPRATS